MSNLNEKRCKKYIKWAFEMRKGVNTYCSKIYYKNKYNVKIYYLI